MIAHAASHRPPATRLSRSSRSHVRKWTRRFDHRDFHAASDAMRSAHVARGRLRRPICDQRSAAPQLGLRGPERPRRQNARQPQRMDRAENLYRVVYNIRRELKPFCSPRHRIPKAPVRPAVPLSHFPKRGTVCRSPDCKVASRRPLSATVHTSSARQVWREPICDEDNDATHRFSHWVLGCAPSPLNSCSLSSPSLSPL